MRQVLASLWFALHSAGQNFRRNLGVSLAGVFTMGLIIFLVGGSLLFTHSVDTVLQGQEQNASHLKIYLSDNASLAAITNFESRLKHDPRVISVTLRDQGPGQASRRRRTRRSASALDVLGSNPLPASLNLDVRKLTDLSQFNAEAKATPIVDSTTPTDYNSDVIGKLNTVITVIQWVGAIIAIILLTISIVIIMNTIRTAVYSRRTEIEIMKLVGATDWFVRWPFILEGMLGGIARCDLLGGGGVRRVPSVRAGGAGQPAERAVRRALHDHPAHRAADRRRRRRRIRAASSEFAGSCRPDLDGAGFREPTRDRSCWLEGPRRYTQDPVAERFDIAILGGGMGGYPAAIRAAQLGLSVVLVEEDKVGGTCLHRGCIPAKALLQSAALLDELRHADVVRGHHRRRPLRLLGRRAPSRPGGQPAAQGRAVPAAQEQGERVSGRGRLDGAGRLVVTPPGGDALEIEAGSVIIATGSRPKQLPGAPADGNVILTSDEALRMDRVPASAIVLGAGAVGVEFASLYRSCGAEVTIVEMLPSLVPLEDAAVGDRASTPVRGTWDHLPDRAPSRPRLHRAQRGWRRRDRGRRGRQGAAAPGRSAPGRGRQSGQCREHRHRGDRGRGRTWCHRRRRDAPHR